MTLDRHLARLLAAVIVMIAATFGVSVAQAHEGHVHHSRATHASAPVQTKAPVAAKAEAPAAVSVIQQTRQPAAVFLALAAQADADDLGRTGGCDGQCCAMGMACCHAAVTPATLPSVPLQTISTVILSPQQSLPPSLAPEALPKPPRSFA